MVKEEYFNRCNAEYMETYIDQSLIKQKDDFYPVIYYIIPRANYDFPETKAITGLETRKSSRLVELPNKSDSGYYACVVYARKNDFAKINSLFGYSLYQITKITANPEIYNANKFNYYGEMRKPDETPVFLVNAACCNESEIREYLKKMEKTHDINASYYKVLRNMDGQPQEYYEINCDMSKFYNLDYMRMRHEKLYYLRPIMYDALCNFDGKNICLVQFDGQDLCKIDRYKDKIQDFINKKSQNQFFTDQTAKFVDYFISKGFAIDYTIPEIMQAPRTYKKNESISPTSLENQVELTRFDDDVYRTVLFYLDKQKKRYGLDIRNNISADFPDNKMKLALTACEKDKPIYAKGISINRKDDENFAATMPLYYRRWGKIGLLKGIEYIKYLNIHNELCDCSQTPFALVQTENTNEVDNLLNELSERYNFKFQSKPVVRTVDDEAKKCYELSLDWFSNNAINYIKLEDFRQQTAPILQDIKSHVKDYSAENELEQHYVYANGAIK